MKAQEKKDSILWTDAELRTAVEAYVYLLRLQLAGIPYSLSALSEFLETGPLSGRNEASIRYRMRNISDVFYKKGWPTVSYYSPAPQVGSGVRRRIEIILEEISSSIPTLMKEEKNRSQDLKNEALEKLNDLYAALSSTQINRVGIGHNNPPEPIDASFSNIDVINALEEVRVIRNELLAISPDEEKIRERASTLLKFGLKFAVWTGERLTKFSDSILVSAGKVIGPAAVIHLSGLAPKIVETIQAIYRFIAG